MADPTVKRLSTRFSLAAPTMQGRTWDEARFEIQQWIEVATSILDSLATLGELDQHNDLNGLQGGNETERYHFTATEHAYLDDHDTDADPHPQYVLDTEAAVLSRVELDFGSTAVVAGTFVVVDVTVVPTSKIMMVQSGAAATGKQADEAEFDAIDCRCEPLTGSFRVYATSLLGSILGKFKFDYVVRAV